MQTRDADACLEHSKASAHRMLHIPQRHWWLCRDQAARTCQPTAVPVWRPLMLSLWKWMPPRIRLYPAQPSIHPLSLQRAEA